jgi:hypothetical protein
MKAAKFWDAQKAFILEQGADGIPVGQINELFLIYNTQPSI